MSKSTPLPPHLPVIVSTVCLHITRGGGSGFTSTSLATAKPGDLTPAGHWLWIIYRVGPIHSKGGGGGSMATILNFGLRDRSFRHGQSRGTSYPRCDMVPPSPSVCIYKLTKPSGECWCGGIAWVWVEFLYHPCVPPLVELTNN